MFPLLKDKELQVSYPQLLDAVLAVCRETKEAKGEKDRREFSMFAAEKGHISREEANVMLRVLKDFGLHMLETQEISMDPLEARKDVMNIVGGGESSPAKAQEDLRSSTSERGTGQLVAALVGQIFAYAEFFGEKRPVISYEEFKAWKERTGAGL